MSTHQSWIPSPPLPQWCFGCRPFRPPTTSAPISLVAQVSLTWQRQAGLPRFPSAMPRSKRTEKRETHIHYRLLPHLLLIFRIIHFTRISKQATRKSVTKCLCLLLCLRFGSQRLLAFGVLFRWVWSVGCQVAGMGGYSHKVIRGGVKDTRRNARGRGVA